MINLYYSGRGIKDNIRFADGDMRYEKVVKHVLDCAKNFVDEKEHSKNVRCSS
jgi:hypothetical protein